MERPPINDPRYNQWLFEDALKKQRASYQDRDRHDFLGASEWSGGLEDKRQKEVDLDVALHDSLSADENAKIQSQAITHPIESITELPAHVTPQDPLIATEVKPQQDESLAEPRRPASDAMAAEDAFTSNEEAGEPISDADMPVPKSPNPGTTSEESELWLDETFEPPLDVVTSARDPNKVATPSFESVHDSPESESERPADIEQPPVNPFLQRGTSGAPVELPDAEPPAWLHQDDIAVRATDRTLDDVARNNYSLGNTADAISEAGEAVYQILDKVTLVLAQMTDNIDEVSKRLDRLVDDDEPQDEWY